MPALLGLHGTTTPAAAGPLLTEDAAVPTYRELGHDATATLLQRYYQGHGQWRACLGSDCRLLNSDWGADALTYTLFLRWETTRARALKPYLAELAAGGPVYPIRCKPRCLGWSDVPAWDAVAALRLYEALDKDPRLLERARHALGAIEQTEGFASGACPSISYQRLFGRPDKLKTLETDATAIKADLLLYTFGGERRYLRTAIERYAAVRRYFLDARVPLYSTYVFDDGRSCVQLPHRFFASVNGEMISDGVLLYRATGNRAYRDEAIETAAAVQHQISDGRGIFTDLQAENDIVEPLVEGMYDLAVGERVAFARAWIMRNASAAVSAHERGRAYGRFFDGPPPAGDATAWQSNGGFALEIAAAALSPDAAPLDARAWKDARYIERSSTELPATLQFFGSAIAVVGTLGERCCQSGHARVFIDGRETFDRTGIWQNKSSAGRSIADTVLFAWRWPSAGAHVLRFEPGEPNAKEGAGYLHLAAYYLKE